MDTKAIAGGNTKRDAISEAWDKNGIIIEPLRLKLAPEVFVATQDDILPNGIMVKRSSSYFNWATAKALSDEGKLGTGWRLPTEEEMDAISKYSFGPADLPLRGYIGPNDMTAYARIPRASMYNILNSGHGYIWTSSRENEMYAYYAEITTRGIIKAGASIYRSFGLSILPVKDI